MKIRAQVFVAALVTNRPDSNDSRIVIRTYLSMTKEDASVAFEEELKQIATKENRSIPNQFNYFRGACVSMGTSTSASYEG